MGPTFFSIIYKKIVKPIFFLFDAESVHNLVSFLGELMGKSVTATITLEKLFGKKHPSLKQKIVGIDFESPVGLAAGFDYEAKLT
ncbi:MAG: Dihydroorotate dehydrogenase (quinone), partial [Candidatus Levybacteria bacterium GW2011_GWA2_41_15]